MNATANFLSRRSVFGALGGGALGIALTAESSPAVAAAAATSALKVYDVVADYGASPSKSDNTSSFQAAITAAGNAGGGIVFVSKPGTYDFSGVLTMPPGVQLLGLNNGLGLPTGNNGCPTTILAVNPTSATTSAPFILASPPGLIQGLQFLYNDQNPSSPTGYPPTIAEAQNSAGGLVLRDLYLPNTFNGIYLGYTPWTSTSQPTSGRALIDSVYMGAFSHGIQVDHTQDVTRINNVHIWPFFGTATTYALDNCFAMIFYSAFSLQLANIFILGTHVGVGTYDSADTLQPNLTSYGQISNLYTDTCQNGFAGTSSYNPTGNGAPGWTVSNFYCASSASSDIAVNLSPGGNTGQFPPALQVLGGALWGQFQDIVVVGSSSDFFRATLWTGYN
jgi:hypothetical protein